MVSYKKLYEKTLNNLKNRKQQILNLKKGTELKETTTLKSLNHSKELDLKLLELTNKHNTLGFNGYDKVYIVFLDNKGRNKSLLGYFRKETLNHIKINIYNDKLRFFYSYLINKSLIQSIKIYGHNIDDPYLKILKEQKGEL